jgi:hypothetical protein
MTATKKSNKGSPIIISKFKENIITLKIIKIEKIYTRRHLQIIFY